jgi:tetratricopeptide (TPR) repeat protein
MLLQQDEPERSESIYAEILQGDPENSRAMVSLARLSARKGALDTARDWLTRAQTAGADKTRLALEWAAISLMSGDPEKARLALTEVTELQPKNMQALGMLAVAMLQQNETDEVEKRVLPKMESVAGTPDHYLVQVTRGQLAFRKGKENYNTAREAFERAAALRPGVVVLLEWILRLDFLLDDKAQAERHARQILRVNRDNSFANYVMGSLMMERGRGTESEEYLRRSLLSTRTAASLNDLAELLRQNGKIREAEDYARAAVNLAPDLYNAWDTLGGVLVASKRYDEAEEAFNKALDIFKDDLRVHLNLALLLQRRGNLVRAREIVTGLLLRRLELPPKERADLDRLASQLSAPARR